MASFEDHVADLLIHRGPDGFIYRCRRCDGVMLTPREIDECAPPCPGPLELIFRIGRGRIEHWRHRDRVRPIAYVRRALERRPAIALAVLFGSRARGDEGPLSDVDLMIAWCDQRASWAYGRLPSVRLGLALGEPVGLEVQIVTVEQAEDSPMLLADVLAEGRVLVNRDGRWEQLKAREPEILRRAAEEERERARSAEEAVRRISERADD